MPVLAWQLVGTIWLRAVEVWWVFPSWHVRGGVLSVSVGGIGGGCGLLLSGGFLVVGVGSSMRKKGNFADESWVEMSSFVGRYSFQYHEWE